MDAHKNDELNRPSTHRSHHSHTPPAAGPSRGEWYDLQNFDHPGGPVALALCVGRDGTALFESHHYLIEHKRLMSILSKFKVPHAIAQDLKTMDPRDDGAHYGEMGSALGRALGRESPRHPATPPPRLSPTSSTQPTSPSSKDWDAFDKDPLTIDIKAMVLGALTLG